jgi:multiple sugar transport system ATP-binding protein
MAGITFTNVSKRFGETRVINALSLEIRDREFMVLVGPSGCGKSTALRMIAGLEEITDGELAIGDRIVNGVPPKDRDVAMVFQNYALYPHMTVFENIAFGLRIRKVPPVEIDRLVGEIAGTLSLTPLLSRKPKELSGGQRQRVALGRAIVRKPAVFLFDEPLSNLDAELRVQMRAEIARLQQRLQTTTVYVTHDQVEAMTLGHRICVLAPTGPSQRPNLQQVGTPLELYDHPQNLFVAKFLGSPQMNLLKVAVSGDGSSLEGPGFRIPPPEPFVAALRAYAGRAVVMGVRPEHVGEQVERGSPRTAAIRGPVEIIETVGHEVIVHARIGDDLVIAKLRSHRVPKFGETVELAIDCDAVHLFDKDSERRLV